MKKEALLSVIMLASAVSVRALPVEVSLSDGHDIKHSTSHPSAHPTVTYDDDEITIKSDSIIQDLNVVIRDQYGEVLHSSTVTASQDGTFIYVPKCGDSEKTTIDLYYDRKHLRGCF